MSEIPTMYVATAPYSTLLEELAMALAMSEGVLKLTGENGCGKTALCEQLVGKLRDENYQVVFFSQPPDSAEILENTIVDALDLPDGRYFTRTLTRYLQQDQKRSALVVIIDDAQQMDFLTFSAVRMLGNIQDDKKALVRILLCGNEELNQKLNQPPYRSLAQQIGYSAILQHMTEAQAADFVRALWSLVKGETSLPEDAQPGRLYLQSQGKPQALYNLALEAATKQRPVVETEQEITPADAITDSELAAVDVAELPDLAAPAPSVEKPLEEEFASMASAELELALPADPVSELPQAPSEPALVQTPPTEEPVTPTSFLPGLFRAMPSPWQRPALLALPVLLVAGLGLWWLRADKEPARVNVAVAVPASVNESTQESVPLAVEPDESAALIVTVTTAPDTASAPLAQETDQDLQTAEADLSAPPADMLADDTTDVDTEIQVSGNLNQDTDQAVVGIDLESTTDTAAETLFPEVPADDTETVALAQTQEDDVPADAETDAEVEAGTTALLDTADEQSASELERRPEPAVTRAELQASEVETPEVETPEAQMTVAELIETEITGAAVTETEVAETEVIDSAVAESEIAEAGMPEISASDTAISEPVAASPEPASPAIELADTRNDDQEITATLDAWIGVWLDRNVAGYLSYYDEQYVPAYADTVAEWRRQRERNINNADELRITYSDLDIRHVPAAAGEPRRARLRFWLAYRSATYSDNTLKELEFVYTTEGWKILSERNIELNIIF